MRSSKWVSGFVVMTIIAPALGAAPAEVITYQGQLKQDGAPLNGFVDLRFTLWDDPVAVGGTPPVKDRLAVEVVHGLFTVTLDFPASAYAQAQWLGIEVRTPAGSPNAYESLTPRQAITGAPYALYALNVLGGGGGSGGTLDQAYDFGGPGAGRTITADAGAVTIAGPGGLSVSGGITSGPVKLNVNSNDFDVQVTRGPVLLSGDPPNVTLGGKYVTNPLNPVPHWAYLNVASSVHRITRDSGADFRFAVETAPNAQFITDQMTLTANGNVGIGTTAPTALLHVNGSTDVASGGGIVLGTISAANLAFDTNEILARNNGVPAPLTLNRNGNVGIGSGALSSIRCSVQVPNTDSDTAFYAATYGSGRAGLFESHQSNTTHAVRIFKNNGPALVVSSDVTANDPATDVPLAVLGGSDSTPSGGGFAVFGGTAGTNISIDNNEIMARDAGATAPLALNASGGNVNLIQGGTGNVGIGTSSPGHRLDVAGRVRVREGGGVDSGIWFYQMTPAADQAFVGMFGDNFVGLYGNNGAGWGFGMSASTGNVGVGTTTPKSKLHVNGDYYGRGHLYLYAYEGDGASGTAFVQARDDSTTSNIDLRLRSKAGAAAVDVLTCKSNGRVGIGTTAPASLLDVAGTARVNVLTIDGGADLSENFDVLQDTFGLDAVAVAEPGTVVAIDPENPGKLRVATSAYDTTVAGIISGAGGVGTGMVMAHEGTLADGKHPVALTGRVYCKVDATQGAIKPGDLLTSSNTLGHAMKVIDRERAHGAILGKAMTALPQGERGLVLVLVSLQ